MKHLLLVDDDADMSKIVARWLERAGYAVTAVTSGEAALTEVKAVAFDLILLDVGMPGMDGPATLKELRKIEAVKSVPVLFRTGKEEPLEQEMLDALKPCGVISKAEGKPQLLTKIAEYL